MTNLTQIILDIVLPRHCVICKQRGNDLCELCLASFELCHRELPSNQYAHFDYRDPRVRSVIQSMKYHNRFRIAEVFAPILYEDILGISNELLKRDTERILLVAIPSHQKKVRARGFNQSDLLARSIMKHDRNRALIYNLRVLRKVRETVPQAQTKSKKERLHNLVGVFDVIDPNIIRGNITIVIDDVITTGATFTEARRALKSAGAKKVIGLAIAH